MNELRNNAWAMSNSVDRMCRMNEWQALGIIINDGSIENDAIDTPFS